MENKRLTAPWSDAVRLSRTVTQILGEPLLAAEILEGALWPDGPVCPHCEAPGAKLMGGVETTSRRTWICQSCGKTYSVRHGTWLYRGRMGLDRVLYAMLILHRSGSAMAIQKLVENTRVAPEIADKLVRQIEENCCADPEPEPEPVEPPKRRWFAAWWPWAAGAALCAGLAAVALWPSQDLTSEDSLRYSWSFDLDGKPIRGTIVTERGRFESTRDWVDAHRAKVEAIKTKTKP